MEKYKKVDCWGPVLNNTNGEYLPFFYEDAYKIMKDYKFYISFENKKSLRINHKRRI